MRHEIKDDGAAMIVSFSGEIDLDHSRAARDILIGCIKNGKPILVDLSDVSYIDSSGIASLVETLQTAKKKSTTLTLVSVSEACMRVLKLARLDTVFTIADNLDEAKSKLS